MKRATLAILIAFSYVSFADTDIQRGDLAGAIAESERELRAIAESDPDAFDLEHLREVGTYAYMCYPEYGSYSAEVDALCAKLEH